MSRNYYMVYPGNIILAILGDETPSVRAEAMDLIRDMRQCTCWTNIGSLRKRDLNFQTDHYTDLTNLRAAGADITEPHYCRAMDDEQIDPYLVTPLRTGVLNNTQSAESAVKLTKVAVTVVSGEERQDGCALNKLVFRRPCPG